MDNLCHTLVGAALAQSGLKRYSRYGTATLLIAANIPDLDALVFLTNTPSVSFRRGWTHGALADAVLPAVLTASVLAWHRVAGRRRGDDEDRPTAPWALLALSYIGVLSHVFLDFLNTYGIRLLMPFSNRWFYGDSVFIIDPWLWLTFGLGAWWTRRSASPAAARLALAIGAVYIGAMMALSIYSREVVLDRWQAANGAPPEALMVGPAPLNPLRKTIIVDAGDRYSTGRLVIWPRALEFDSRAVPKNNDGPSVATARADPEIQAILVWARFPYYEVDRSADGRVQVTVSDLRFGRRLGSASVTVD